jgi:hypothetical protein
LPSKFYISFHYFNVKLSRASLYTVGPTLSKSIPNSQAAHFFLILDVKPNTSCKFSQLNPGGRAELSKFFKLS